MNEQFHFEFHGMSPSDWTESFLQDEFASLLAMAPPNAHLKLKVEKFQAGIEAKLIVYSDAGAFIVEDKSEDITSLAKTLKKKMKSKLHKWKEVHYNHHGRAS